MLHQQAETYSTTPAALMGITDAWEALAVNRAVLWAGRHEPPKPKGLDLRKVVETNEGGPPKRPPRRKPGT